MPTREYGAITGIETPDLPTATDPVADDDTMTKRYADAHYLRGFTLISDVKAIAAVDRSDNTSVWIEELQAYFYFDAASVLAGNDLTVIVPTVGTGRWIRHRAGCQNVIGTSSSPTLITAGGGIPLVTGAARSKIYVKGSGGPVDISANPQIQAGIFDGQQLTVVGCDDTATVLLEHGTGLELNGPHTLGKNESITLDWDGTANLWVETARSER